MSKPLVSIKCLVYNHEPYLRQCLDGFVMQKTNFPFEAIVHDDASTDHSADIIREYAEKYPDIIKPIYETENQWSKHDGSLAKIMDEACKGRYIALCEGDDYWTDPLKLQKQADILEGNKDVAMIYTGFQPINAKSQKIYVPYLEYYMKKSHSGNILIDLVNGNYIMTLTTMLRKEVFNTNIYRSSPIHGLDYNIFLSAAAIGKIYYLPEKTGCYRITQTGAMHTMNKWVNSSIDKVRLYFVRCIINCKIDGLTRNDKNIAAFSIWRQILSLKSFNRKYLHIIITNPKIFIFLPYTVKRKIMNLIHKTLDIIHKNRKKNNLSIQTK